MPFYKIADYTGGIGLMDAEGAKFDVVDCE